MDALLVDVLEGKNCKQRHRNVARAEVVEVSTFQDVTMSKKTKCMTMPMVQSLPAELKSRKENDDNGFWIFATREVVDSMGDIVRVDGMDMKTYHNPPETHLKILAQHLRSLPNGHAPVVGRVTDSAKAMVPYKENMVKSLALYVEWLRDEQGKLLDLSAHYKSMKEAGGIDSVSVGFIVEEFKWLEDGEGEKTGGWDITKGTLYECSLVTIPANAGATFVRSMMELGYGVENVPELRVRAAEANVEYSVWEEKLDLLLAGQKSVAQRIDVFESALTLLRQPTQKPVVEPVRADYSQALDALRKLTKKQ